MNDINYEFKKNLEFGINWGTKIGSVVGSTFVGFTTAILLGIYNAWVKIKDNEYGGKDIQGGIDGRNEKLLLQKIANDYFGQVGYSEIENPMELHSAIENFDKEVWDKYCKEYNLTYSAVEEKGANGKVQTKINVSEKKARDLERVFKAYANEMQSKERTISINNQWELLEYKAKEKNVDINKLKEDYERYPNFRDELNNKLLELDEKQKLGEKDFGETGRVVFRIAEKCCDLDENPKKEEILINEITNNFQDKNKLEKEISIVNLGENELNETEIIFPEVDYGDLSFSVDDILGEGTEEKVGKLSFKEHLKEITEKPEVKEQIEKQVKEKNKNHGELDR